MVAPGATRTARLTVRPAASVTARSNALPHVMSPGAAAIVGRGECYGVTRSIGFTRGIAHDGDPADPVAHVSATFMFTG